MSRASDRGCEMTGIAMAWLAIRAVQMLKAAGARPEFVYLSAELVEALGGRDAADAWAALPWLDVGSFDYGGGPLLVSSASYMDCDGYVVYESDGAAVWRVTLDDSGREGARLAVSL